MSRSRSARSARRSPASAAVRREAARRAPPGPAAPRRRTDPADVRLAPHDRGPVRAFVRDAVDARRRLVGLLLPALGAVVLAAVAPASDLRRYLLIGCLALLAAAVVDALVLGATVTRSARAALPGEPVPALATSWYAFLRAHRARSVRRPPPRVGPGSARGSRAR